MKKTTLLLFLILSSISFLQMDCKDEPPVTVDPPPTGPDTTSHNFTWTTYTFGGNAGSCYFKDVAIINDSNIWAVGAIYTSPETLYNAAHWDGKKWDLIRLYYNVSSLISFIRGICVINSENVYLAAGSIFHWNGSSQQTELIFSRLSLPDANATIEKIWGASGNNIFGVGNSGTIVHYNGIAWSKQESGTTIDLQDVWGSADGKTVWACGYSNDDGQSILIKYDSSKWITIWKREGNIPQNPFEYFVTSVWADKSLYLSTGRGVYRVASAETTKAATLPWFPYRIRGSGENNMATAGDRGMIWHYNGANWKEISSQTDHSQYSIAVSKNMIVAVGTDNSIGFGAGLVRMGKRIP